jgi:hypothetical protein
MPKPPETPDRLPSLEHSGVTIEIYNHHGYLIPDKGNAPKSRILYAARDEAGERHWRGSLEEICLLIDRGFAVAPIAS